MNLAITTLACYPLIKNKPAQCVEVSRLL